MDTITVEIVQKNKSSSSEASLIKLCKAHLFEHKVLPGTLISTSGQGYLISSDVDYIIVSDFKDNKSIDYFRDKIKWFVYKLIKSGSEEDAQFNDEKDEIINLTSHTSLPSSEIFGTWENLIYDHNIKEKLLNYFDTMMIFNDKGIKEDLVNYSGVVLLFGPPGTGKTSLCKAISQKLSIRLSHLYKKSVLYEVHTNNLFSKYYSESGKLVSKMFSSIISQVESPDTFVCLLVDEVESLVISRENSAKGNECSDNIKVVNQVLVKLDKLKSYKNVLILTTSNLSSSLDHAFLDRAAIKQYIGLPSPLAISKIYLSSIQELIRGRVINTKMDFNQDCNDKLMKISEESENLSGRTLRRIPALAHAFFLADKGEVDLNDFLEAMSKAVKDERNQGSFCFDNNKQSKSDNKSNRKRKVICLDCELPKEINGFCE